jgi:hypothetical protein
VPRRRSLVTYLLLLAFASALAGVAFRLSSQALSVLACRQNADPDVFLAYCNDPQFGDYEHGAYFFDLEPSAIEHLRTADVIFFGNSRVQYAFSTDALQQYFRERSIRYYLLGFGYQDRAAFALALIEKYHLKPKAVVIDADPFFDDYLSLPAAKIVGDARHLWITTPAWLEYVKKKQLIKFQLSACRLYASACSSQQPALYRSRTDGAWIWRDLFGKPREQPIDAQPGEYLPKEEAVADQSIAAKFLLSVGVKPSCAIITAIPNSNVDTTAYAADIGNLIGAPVVQPLIPGLATIDGSHLTASSAARWSTEFLRQSDSIFQKCMVGAALLTRDGAAIRAG